MSMRKTQKYFKEIKLTSVLGIIVAVVTLVSAITTSVLMKLTFYVSSFNINK